MKLGLGLGYSGATFSLPMDLIQRAEALGYDSVWTAESYGTDALTPLAFIAGQTKRIKLGTSIAQLDARSPANLAMCAQTIDALAGGDRMLLGVGTSGPQIVEGWYGRPWGKANPKLRDAVAICKKIWKREGPVVHHGKAISLPYDGPDASGLGKPLKSILHGNPNIPIYLGTDTDLNVRMTAEVADGWIGMHVTPGLMSHYLPLIKEGLAKRTDGKTLKDFAINGGFAVRIVDDVKAALQEPKPYYALYIGGMGAKDKNFHKDSMIKRGYAEAAERIQELYLAGHKEEAALAVPDEYVDEGTLIGPPERIKDRYNASWRDSGITSLAVRNAGMAELELMAKVAL